MILTADEAVADGDRRVYRRFAELGSARQVMLSLREDGLLLPRRQNGSRRITWAAASYPAVHDFLTNPAYAGAFVFGRTRTEKRVDAAGKVVSSVRVLPHEEWAVLITGHHPGYLDWEAYEANTSPAARELAAAARARRRCRPARRGAAVRACSAAASAAG